MRPAPRPATAWSRRCGSMRKVCADQLARRALPATRARSPRPSSRSRASTCSRPATSPGGDDAKTSCCATPRAASTSGSSCRDDQIVGAVLYGDTADGAWYFDLLRDGKDISEIRDRLIFGQAFVGDGGHAGPKPVAALARRGRDLRLQRRLQGQHRQGDRRKDAVTLDAVRAHTKASASCGSCTGLVESCSRSRWATTIRRRRRSSRCANAPASATTTSAA